MEHRIEKISRPIASEWATRAIRPVSTGSEAQGEDARIRIAKGGNRPAPVFPIHVSAAADARNLAALEAIRALPDAYRETLMLRLVEGMTGEEIAARTGMTPASVRVNLHRGMKQLRQKLDCEGRA